MKETAVVLGVGVADGLGGAIARRFAKQGYHTIIGGRTEAKIQATADALVSEGLDVRAAVVDVTNEEQQQALFQQIGDDDAPLAAVIYNAGNNLPMPFKDLTSELFEQLWRVCCHGAFLTAKAALPLMEAQGHGSLLFTGASASLRGKPNFAHFSAGKGALRNLVQALAREFGPKGVHVAHVIIDGLVNGDIVRNKFGDYLQNLGEDGGLEPTAVADMFMTLHQQPRSIWTHEMDLRPFKENW